jgi:hypothetical protein
LGIGLSPAIKEPMAARVTLKAINDELAKRGHNARLERASGYFYFMGGEATEWIDRTVQAASHSRRAHAGSVDRRVRASEESERGDYEGRHGKGQTDAEAGLT